ncbi:UDP-glycosyltransferase 91D1 [Cryptomeria japonica]|uniref:UDP-glycosyltransferase 91D1 n=1 Tax=Cryptomeria japonica TaxID=3369 RepID=UPI0027DA43C3|nr:UDP-glycosyltransferase 91D1 [Cryptomeria japonica]
MQNLQFDISSLEEEMQQLHVMMVPWLSYSHIRAFLEFAKILGAHGLEISFLSTPLNNRWIRQQISQLHPIPEIDLLQLPLPSVEGLPAGVESTADLKRGGTFELLIKAMDEWEKPFEALLARISPDFVIHDMTQYWASRIAAKLGIPTIFFANTSAVSSGFLLGYEAVIAEESTIVPDLTVPPPGFPSAHIRHSQFQGQKNLHVLQKKEGQINMAERWNMCFNGSWVIAFNTCIELEAKYLEYLQRTSGRPVLPVGIQMPDLTLPPADDRCLAWLDVQKPYSVVVVSLGSECILTPKDLAALALGLEESELPFLFVLLHQMAAALPRGFVGRTKGRGLLVTEWAPQLHILAHSSAGGFLTHCGWSLVSEGLRFGVPIVTLPMQYEQGLNAKLIAQELKLGVEVRRNEEDDSFSKEDICKAVWTLIVEEEGRYIRSRIQEINAILTRHDCQIHRSNIHNFVSLIKEKAGSLM